MVTIVVLTIFIYASYSSTQTLAPPPMRNSALSASLVAFSMANNRSNSVSNSEAETAAAANVKNSRAILTHYDNLPPAGGGSHGNEMIFVKKLTHHREPTIDENAIDGGGEAGAAAAGAGGGGGTGAGSGGMGDDLVGDDTALEHFNNNNNDLLQEEQYVQSVDNNLGKFCNVIIE